MKKFSIIVVFLTAVLILTADGSAQEQRVLQIAGKVVPDLTGISMSDAVTVCGILKLPLQKAMITAVDERYAGREGQVVKQTPAPGAQLAKGQRVVLYIYSQVRKPHALDNPGGLTFAVSTVDLAWNDDAPRFVLPPGRQPILVATLVNDGTGAAPANTLEWQVQLLNAGGSTIYDKRDTRRLPLAGGENQVINFQNIPLSTYQETDMILLIINPDQKVKETDYGNNIVEQKNLPDLAITDIKVEGLETQYRISATVRNIGARPMQGNFSYTWTLNNEQKPSSMISLVDGSKTLVYGVNKSMIPAGRNIFPVKLHVNDGLAGTGKIWEELEYENNVLEVELELE